MVDMGPTLVLLAVLVLLVIAARRYQRRQIRAGRWDAKGPLVETRGPVRPGEYYGSIEERREVVGEWKAPVVRDRRLPGRHAEHDSSAPEGDTD